MKKLIVITIFFGMTSVSAGKKKEHRHHDAHVHGAATLSLAFDQLKGQLEFKAASEGVLGFEHEAKSEEDKQKLNATIEKFITSIATMVQFDDSAGCLFTKEKIGMVAEKSQGGHSDFVAHFNIECKKEIQGSQVTFDFSQFKGIKNLDVTLLIGDLQKSVQVKRKPVTVDIK
jgi:hypothetical protein